MKEYIVNNIASKDDFYREGFRQHGDINSLRKSVYVFKKLISLEIYVDFRDEIPWCRTNIRDQNCNSYPINSDFGADLVRDQVRSRYEEEMENLVRLGLLLEVREKSAKLRKSKCGQLKRY